MFTQDQPTINHSSPATLVLQWLTYTLWGLLAGALSILLIAVLSSAIADTQSGDLVAFAVASVLVLLPLSIISDGVYAKREPAKKTGGTTLIMVIHAVLFALISIGALIAAVFSLVFIGIHSSDSDNKAATVAIVSGLLIAVLYAVTFVRTVNPPRFAIVKRLYIIFMTISVGIVALFGILGPIAKTHQTRTDRLIESSLYDVSSGIDDYVRDHKQLPDSLQTVSYTGDAAKLVQDNLIEYQANTKPISYEPNGVDANGNAATIPTYYYQLCVHYTAKDSNTSDDYAGGSSGDYDSSIDTNGHKAGRVCYKVSTYNY